MMPGPTWICDGSEIPDPLGHGERAVRFLRLLKHPKSRLPDRQFQLDPWQERIVRRVYGPVDEHGARLTRTVYLQVGKGSRKTSLAAGLSLLHTFGPERVPRGENLVAAADRKQARIAYEEAASIVAEVPQLAGASRPVDSRNRLTHPKSGAWFEAISSDAATQHGRTPVFALVDELWGHRKSDLWHAIRTGVTKVAGSLLIVATTAGRGNESPDFAIYEYARKVQSGEISDPHFLPIVFEADREAPWDDEATWRTVLPGLAHGYPDLPSLRQLAREAKERPADREAFRQFYLGIRLDRSTAPFVDMHVYDEGADAIDLEALEGRPCWLGLDASSTTDLTSVVAAFPDEDEGFIVLAWFFVPADNLRRRGEIDGVPYPRWSDEGHLIATEGNVVDYAAVEALIRELCDRFDVREIAADPAYSRQITLPLVADGLPVVEFRQGWRSMGPAISELERAIIGRRFRHGGNPLLRWCFENVAITTDSAGNRSFHKGRSRDRIDGAVASAMAVARAAEAGGIGPSVYADQEQRPEGFLFV